MSLQDKIEKMRVGGKILHTILHEAAEKIIPGMNVLDIEEDVDLLFEKYEVIPSFLGYQGYPSSICLSVNDEVVHSIPKDRILHEGDIITLDCGVNYGGYHTDSAITVCVGGEQAVDPNVLFLVKSTKEALTKAIKVVRAGVRVGEISHTIGSFIRLKGLRVVDDLGGHGIGKHVHEEPYIANEGTRAEGPILREGMTIAIEPIVCLGKSPIVVDKNDKWTIRTKDGSWAAQFEHTLLVLEGNAEILT